MIKVYDFKYFTLSTSKTMVHLNFQCQVIVSHNNFGILDKIVGKPELYFQQTYPTTTRHLSNTCRHSTIKNHSIELQKYKTYHKKANYEIESPDTNTNCFFFLFFISAQCFRCVLLCSTQNHISYKIRVCVLSLLFFAAI